jgi:hypothetical protein
LPAIFLVGVLLLFRTYFSSCFLLGGLDEIVLSGHATVLDGLSALSGLVGLGVDVVLGGLHAILHRVLSVVEGSARLGLAILSLKGGWEGEREGRRRSEFLN